MCAAVAGGLTVRVAISQVFGSKTEYYTRVSIEDRLAIRRLSLENTARSRQGEHSGQVIKVSTFLEPERHEAVSRRTEQLSIQKGRLVTINEYINSLIAADLRTAIDSDSVPPVGTT
nr:hypothetical protein A6C57_07025 [Fibrella sp. ES10-3-2-2]